MKIGDFGISKREEEDVQSWSTLKGTSGFLAPELLGFCNHAGATAIDHKAADMWALGETIVLILTLQSTFDNLRALVDYCRGQGSLPIQYIKKHGISDEGYRFIERLMEANPEDRLKVEDGLKDEWFQIQNDPSYMFSTSPTHT